MAELDPRQLGAVETHSLVPNGAAPHAEVLGRRAIRRSQVALQQFDEAFSALLTQDVALGFGEATTIRIVPERPEVIYDELAITAEQQRQIGLTKSYVPRREVDLSIFEFDLLRVEGRAALRPRPDSHSRITRNVEPWKTDAYYREHIADKVRTQERLIDDAIAIDLQEEELPQLGDLFIEGEGQHASGKMPDGEVAIDTVIYTAQEATTLQAPISEFVDWVKV